VAPKARPSKAGFLFHEPPWRTPWPEQRGLLKNEADTIIFLRSRYHCRTPSPMERLPPAGLIEVWIGSVPGKCTRCGGTQFERTMRAPGPFSDTLICTGCRAETTRAALVAGAAKEAVRRTKRMLEAARTPHDSKKKP
jgi:hypothetical protein